MSPEERDSILSWYMRRFVPDPDHYALMNPPSPHPAQDRKYCRRKAPVTPDLLASALNGETRRLPVDGRWHTVPLSVAVVPQTNDGLAYAAILDIDAGGVDAARRALALSAQLGLWGVVQRGESDTHSGGALYLPSAEPLPASFLRSVAQGLKILADIVGDAYPTNADLRLLGMTHLRAPGGPQRFPLLLPDDTLIDMASDPWSGLAQLRDRWRPNPTAAFTAALEHLPQPLLAPRVKRHPSKVNIEHVSNVINWVNASQGLAWVLAMRGVALVKAQTVIHCPFHDDCRPSLSIWTLSDGQQVCRCWSQHSHCPLAQAPYYDAFNVYGITTGLTPASAVEQLRREFGLGEKRTFRSTGTLVQQDVIQPDALAAHEAHLAERTAQLRAALQAAAGRPGTLTVIAGTPGLGKTVMAAQLVREWQAAGKTVAIAAPSKYVAVEEWASRLVDPLVWEARRDLCTCYDRKWLQQLEALSYAADDCRDGCPYKAQYIAARERVVVAQHNHTWLNDGRLFVGDPPVDILIIDEALIAALIEEHRATATDLQQLERRMTRTDPAAALVAALVRVTQTGQGLAPLRGRALFEALQAHLDVPLTQGVDAALSSRCAQQYPIAPMEGDVTRLHRQFLGSLLRALAHDLKGGGNTLLEVGPSGVGAHSDRIWIWMERHAFLERALQWPAEQRPALLSLDGSADKGVYEQLYQAWPVRYEPLTVEPPPWVSLVQVTATPSTRRVTAEPERVAALVGQVAMVGNYLDLIYDGGVTYQALEDVMRESIGGRWLHFNGLRGKNTLAEAQTVAIVCSPTVPPDVILRLSRALCADGEPIDETCTRLGPGHYRYADPRVEAINRLLAAEELRQSIHRARVARRTTPVTVVVFSPWDLEALGLTVSVRIEAIPHGNSAEAQGALAVYQARRQSLAGR